MTYNHAVWQRTSPDLAQGRAHKTGARPPTLAAPRRATEKEKDWLGAVEHLYGPGEKLARDLAYAESMRRMHDKYPADDGDVVLRARDSRHQPWRW